jgi:acyl dehydratase
MTAGTIPIALVGTEVGPVTTDIDARWLMAYAAALGERDRRYFDTERAEGPLAHALFPVCYEWPLALAVRAGMDPALAPRGVHATHRLQIHRLPRAGDRLTTRARVVAVEPRRAGALLIIRFTTVDAGGAPVTTTDHGSLYRGVTCDGASVAVEAGPTECRVPAAGAALASDDEPPWSEPIDIPGGAAHVYSECARIWNPIHTDIAAARAAGLPGLILHGTATLALAVSRIVAHDVGNDPAGVREVSGRFTGMVGLPARLVVRGRRQASGVTAFDVLDAAGVAVVSRGVLGRRRQEPA